MATKTTEATDAPAAVTEEPTAPQAETPHRRGRALQLAALITGGILAAGLLFSGGVLLGVHLPDGGRQPGFSRGELPGGGMHHGGPDGGPQGGFPGGQPPQHPGPDGN